MVSIVTGTVHFRTVCLVAFCRVGNVLFVGSRGCVVIVAGMSNCYSGIGCNSGVRMRNGYVVGDNCLVVLRGCCVAVVIVAGCRSRFLGKSYRQTHSTRENQRVGQEFDIAGKNKHR
jgi:hypothetical protein